MELVTRGVGFRFKRSCPEYESRSIGSGEGVGNGREWQGFC